MMSVIQILSLFISIISFSGSILEVMWIIILLVSIALTSIVFLEKPHLKSAKNLQKTYADFLKQKDLRITELENKNQVLLRTSVKHSDENIQLAQLKRKLEEKTNPSSE